MCKITKEQKIVCLLKALDYIEMDYNKFLCTAIGKGVEKVLQIEQCVSYNDLTIKYFPEFFKYNIKDFPKESVWFRYDTPIQIRSFILRDLIQKIEDNFDFSTIDKIVLKECEEWYKKMFIR